MITFSNEQQLKGIQGLLGVTSDGIWGPKSQAALDKLTAPESDISTESEHSTYASSFADPADVDAFYKCKAQGHSDDYCFSYGDNGIGCYGDSTVEGTGPSCALPPEYTEEKWGSVGAGKHKPVRVTHSNGKAVTCLLKDRMPHIANLANKARIDLTPDACKAIGFKPPIMEKVVWWWES